MAELDGHVALVTGAESGIGEATARLFAEKGAAVLLVHHDAADAARKIVAEIREAGGQAFAFRADVREKADVESAFETARREFGDITLLVNSAGVDAAGIKIGEMELDHFENVIRTNLTGPFLTCSAFVRGLKGKGKKGRILNVTSVHEEIPRAGAADYCASKGALRNLTRCLALELAEEDISVNNIAPGMILTPMNQEAIDDPEKLKQQEASIPMKRAGKPEEVARLALYLASDEAGYVSGATFTIDGALQLNLGQGA